MDQGRKLEEEVFSCIEKYSMIQTGDRVLVGLSGGADSVCLLFLLWEYGKKKAFSLQAVHVNHQIRGDEAKRDETFVKKICEELEIPCSIYTYPVLKMARERHMSVEEAGRLARQTAFLEEGRKSGAYKAALAHHRDDLAETVLHNLARGSGVSGMAGIRPVTSIGELTVIRPLLTSGKEEIVGYLRARGVQWVEDSTNGELSYTRNKIRHQIMPCLGEINEKASEHIARSAGMFLMTEEYLELQRDMLYNRYVKQEENRISIQEEIFGEHPIMQTYVIQKVLVILSGQKKDISAVHLESVRNLNNMKTGSSISLSYGLTALKSYKEIWIFKGKWPGKEKEELSFTTFLYKNQQIPENKYTKWFDYDKIKNNLSVRKRLAGDYLTVTAAGGKKKLKDYFIDCRIPRQERDNITLLAEGSHILWVVGYRISEYYKITPGTKMVLEVHVKGEKEDE